MADKMLFRYVKKITCCLNDFVISGQNRRLLVSRCLVVFFWMGLALINANFASICSAVENKGPVVPKVVAIIYTDESGSSINFPAYVYYDYSAEETYIIRGGGEPKISVFGPEYYPDITLGSLRGIYAPKSLLIAPNGALYICQSASVEKNKKPLITIFNAAFFIQKEIVIENIPGVDEFAPLRFALGREGNIYLVGRNTKGVAILDSVG